MANEHLVNNDINGLRPLIDLITDEYGNHYEVVSVTNKGDKVTEVTLSHIYFEKAFSRGFFEDDLKEYKNKHIGAFLQDVVNNHIEQNEKKHRKIFSIRDLIENEIKVSFLNQTVPHPRSIS